MKITQEQLQAFEKVKDDLLPEHSSIKELIDKVVNGTNLFGTIMIDAYKISEINEIYQALDIVCNKKGYFSFDSYGIYSYWDYDTKEILYIGLSNNLRQRFAQHNGIVKSKKEGTKYQKIQEYFSSKEKIGFSVLLQSPYEHEETFLDNKEEEIKVIEGSLIEQFQIEYGNIPRWNEIGGSINGRREKSLKRYGNILRMITGEEVGDFNSKVTLREVANSPRFLELENDLNVIRARMYKYDETFEYAFEKTIKWNEFLMTQGEIGAYFSNYRLIKLLESGYVEKKINFF